MFGRISFGRSSGGSSSSKGSGGSGVSAGSGREITIRCGRGSYETRNHYWSEKAQACVDIYASSASKYPSGTGSSSREGRGSGSSKSGRDHYESKTQERFADFSGHLGLNSSGQCNVSELFFSRSISVENVTSLSLVGTKMGLNSAKYISPLLSHKNFHFCSMNLTKNQLGDEGVAYMILEKAVGVVEQFKIC